MIRKQYSFSICLMNLRQNTETSDTSTCIRRHLYSAAVNVLTIITEATVQLQRNLYSDPKFF